LIIYFELERANSFVHDIKK